MKPTQKDRVAVNASVGVARTIAVSTAERSPGGLKEKSHSLLPVPKV